MPAEPVMFEDMYWVWEAFTMLSRSRQMHSSGMPMYISIVEIEALCRLLNITNEDNIDLLLRAIFELDEVFLADAVEKKKKALASQERNAAAQQRSR